jgi:uncharacterized protein (DUF1330 family)
MNRYFTIGLAMLGSAAIGAAAVHKLHAQAKPHAFVIAEVNVTDKDAYAKDFVPLVTKSLADSGGKFLARGGRTLSIEGEAPPNRVVINEFESIEQVQAWIASTAYKEAFVVGKKYATFHTFAVEGLSP